MTPKQIQKEQNRFKLAVDMLGCMTVDNLKTIQEMLPTIMVQVEEKAFKRENKSQIQAEKAIAKAEERAKVMIAKAEAKAKELAEKALQKADEARAKAEALRNGTYIAPERKAKKSKQTQTQTA